MGSAKQRISCFTWNKKQDVQQPRQSRLAAAQPPHRSGSDLSVVALLHVKHPYLEVPEPALEEVAGTDVMNISFLLDTVWGLGIWSWQVSFSLE